MFKSLIIILLIAPLASNATQCDETLESQLLNHARVLDSGAATISSLYENSDNGVIRQRRLVDFADGTNSFAEVFSRDGSESNIFFIENQDGSFSRLDTNRAVTAVVRCDLGSLNETVVRVDGFPKILIAITCSEDNSIISNGYIQYQAQKVELVGGPWLKNGVNQTCDGATNLGSVSYYPVY